MCIVLTGAGWRWVAFYRFLFRRRLFRLISFVVGGCLARMGGICFVFDVIVRA
jgi:hypothetical protein